MDKKITNQWLVVTIIVLLAMNIASLSGIWLMRFHKRPQANRGAPVKPLDDQISETVGFDEQQDKEFRRLHNRHREIKDSLESKSRQISNLILDQIFSGSPDTTRMYAYADTIGQIQRVFEQELYRHFLDVKKISQPDQFSRLEPILRKLKPLNPKPLPPEDGREPHDKRPRRDDDRRPPPPPNDR